jgi:glyoxylase-like metal-dependent hydrolase (beta-lactamase superfamily II)
MGKIDTLTTAAPSAPASDEITFPFADYPAAGTAMEVADGIFWISTKVPFVALKQVNLWLLRDGRGWTMIDCGYGKPDVREQLAQTWASVLGGRPITRLIVTHFHPDHAGNSSFIADHWNLRPLMSQGEWFTANLAHADMHTDAIMARKVFYRRHGLSEAKVGKFSGEVLLYKDGVQLPPDYKRLRDGDILSIGDDRWQVVVGEGHSPEHVSLYCAERRILIAGDQILPAITTNVSTWPGEPEFDAVGAFLATCQKFLDLLDPDTLILPSHRKPFFNVRHRLRELAVHHADRLNLLLAGAGRETCAGELIDVLFRSGLDGHQIGFAMGEIIAHLNHLVVLGHMQMIESRTRVRYRRISADDAKVAPYFR